MLKRSAEGRRSTQRDAGRLSGRRKALVNPRFTISLWRIGASDYIFVIGPVAEWRRKGRAWPFILVRIQVGPPSLARASRTAPLRSLPRPPYPPWRRRA